MNIATNSKTGAVIVNAVSAPSPDWTLRPDLTIPDRPTAPGKYRLLWQGGALAWVTQGTTPQDTFSAAVAAGYTVPDIDPPLVLDLSDAARAQFTGLKVLLDGLMTAGQLLATSTQAIADKAGALHALPVSQIDTILLGYGAYYAGLYNQLHAATAAPAPAPAPAAS